MNISDGGGGGEGGEKWGIFYDSIQAGTLSAC